ncbi:hypothetical protein BST61_g9435 [Cercospora zeina]
MSWRSLGPLIYSCEDAACFWTRVYDLEAYIFRETDISTSINHDGTDPHPEQSQELQTRRNAGSQPSSPIHILVNLLVQ